MGQLHLRAAQRILERHRHVVHQVVAHALKSGVRLLSQNEHDVRGRLVGVQLVALFGETNFGSLLESGTDIDGEDLLHWHDLSGGGVAYPLGELDAFLGAGEHLLQRQRQRHFVVFRLGGGDTRLHASGVHATEEVGAAAAAEEVRAAAAAAGAGAEHAAEAAAAATSAAKEFPEQLLGILETETAHAARHTTARARRSRYAAGGEEERAAVGARHAAATTTEPARKPAGTPRPGTAILRHARLHALLTELVVHLALARVDQHLVGLADLLELAVGQFLVVWILVRVPPHRQLAVSALERRLVRIPRHSEDFIVIQSHGAGARSPLAEQETPAKRLSGPEIHRKRTPLSPQQRHNALAKWMRLCRQISRTRSRLAVSWCGLLLSADRPHRDRRTAPGQMPRGGRFANDATRARRE
eukprot:ctg_20.g6